MQMSTSYQVSSLSMSNRFDLLNKSQYLNDRLSDFVNRAADLLRVKTLNESDKNQIKQLIISSSKFSGIVTEILICAPVASAEYGTSNFFMTYDYNDAITLLSKVEMFCNIVEHYEPITLN